LLQIWEQLFPLKAERKAGSWLDENVEAHRPAELSQDVTVIPDGITRKESSAGNSRRHYQKKNGNRSGGT